MFLPQAMYAFPATTVLLLSLFFTFHVHASHSDCEDHAAHRNYPLLPQAPACGVASPPQVDARIQGGQETKLGEFPWLVYVKVDYDTALWKVWKLDYHALCGGSIITERYILTAGHCFLVKDDPIQGVTAYVGEWDKSSDPDRQGLLRAPRRVEVRIEKVIFHPQADYSSLMYDVALMKLQDKLDFNDFVKPICLPVGCTFKYAGIHTGLDMEVVGWGLQANDDHPDKLKKLTTQVVQEANCSTETWLNIIKPDGTPLLSPPLQSETDPWDAKICVQAKREQMPCWGDSGGPLMFTEMLQGVSQKVYVILGVLSFGDKCFVDYKIPERPFPSVFTYVPAIIKWLLDNISE